LFSFILISYRGGLNLSASSGQTRFGCVVTFQAQLASDPVGLGRLL